MNKAIIIVFVFFSLRSFSQSENLVKWTVHIEETEVNEEKNVIFSAEIEPNWQLYSNDFDPNLGPMVSEFVYDVNSTFELDGKTIPHNPHKKFDDLWGGEYTYFEIKGEWNQLIKISPDFKSLDVVITYQVCNNLDGKCIPFDVNLRVE